MTTTLIAKEKFFYNGRNVEQGEQFEAEDTDVMLLTHHHTPKATTIELEPQKAETPDPEVDPGRKAPYDAEQAKSARYRRRDMKAGD